MNRIPEDIIFLLQQSKETLFNMQPVVCKLICNCKDCNKFTRAWCFNLYPWYYVPNIISSKITGKFINVNESFYMCEKHYKIFKRAEKVFGRKAVEYFTTKYSVEIISEPLKTIK